MFSNINESPWFMSSLRFGASSLWAVSLLIPLPALKCFLVLSHWPNDPAAVSSPFSQQNQWNHSGCSTTCTYKALLYMVSNCVAYKWDRRLTYLVFRGESSAWCCNASANQTAHFTVRQETAGPVLMTESFVLGKWYFHQANRGFSVICFCLCDSLVSQCKGERIKLESDKE